MNGYPAWAYPDSNRDEDKLLLEPADGSAVTILAQDGGHEGLQIQSPDGDWLPVPIVAELAENSAGCLCRRSSPPSALPWPGAPRT